VVEPDVAVGEIKTEISFVSGFDAEDRTPGLVKSAGLKHRFAVIQETYRPDKVDMYFDEALWGRLFDFAIRYALDRKTIAEIRYASKEMPAANLVTAGRQETDKKPPPYILVRDGGKCVLCIATEFWNLIGGPWPYHDSYTYSIYSNEVLDDQVLQFLRQANAAHEWQISPDVYPPNPRKYSFWIKLLARLTGFEHALWGTEPYVESPRH
jgi:hypothetical protein